MTADMDLYAIIHELHKERARLTEIIRLMEDLLEDKPGEEPAPQANRRGRTSMSQEERRKVSQRMRKYWAARRKQ